MSDFEEAVEVMKRIEEAKGTKSGGMLVKGTLLIIQGDMIRTTFDSTLIDSFRQYICEDLKEACNFFVREQDPEDELQFFRANYKERTKKESQYQLMFTQEGKSCALILQEYEIRDLRIRPKTNPRNLSAYVYHQPNPFYPSLDH